MRRRLLIVLVSIIALPVALVGAVLVIANTDWGRSRIAGLVVAATADGPVRIDIGRLEGLLPVDATVHDLQLADATGPFATVERLRLAWMPSALLSGRLGIEAVELERLTLQRLPVLPAEPAPKPPDGSGGPAGLGLPELPVAVRLDRLEITEATLAAPVLGVAATVGARLSGGLDRDGARITGWAEAAAPGRVPARAKIDLAAEPATGLLRTSVRITEPAGGLVAELAGLADRSALDLTLSGQGTLADWTGRLEGGFGPGAKVALDLGLGRVEGGIATRVAGTLEGARLAPAQIAPMLAGGLTLEADAAIRDDGAVSLQRSRFGLAGMVLEATAEVDPDGVPVDAKADLSVPDLSVLRDLTDSPVTGGVTVRATLGDGGRVATATVAGAVAVPQATLDAVEIAAEARADRPLASLPDEIAFSVRAGVDTPALPDLDLAALVGRRPALAASGRLAGGGRDLVIESVSLAGDGVSVTGAGRLADGTSLTLAVDARLDDLVRVGDLAGLPIAGAAEASVQGTVELDPLSASLAVAAAADRLSLADPALDGLAGPAPSLSGAVTLEDRDRLTVHDFLVSLASGSARGTVGLDLAAGGLSGRIDLQAPDLRLVGSAVGQDLSGSAAVAVALGGTLEAPAVGASWRVSDLGVAGQRIPSVTGTATAGDLVRRPSGRFETTVETVAGPVRIASDMAVDEDLLTIGGLRIAGLGADLTGDLRIRTGLPVADGRIVVQVDDLGAVGKGFGLPLASGSVDLVAELSAGEGQEIVLDGGATGLAVADGETRVELDSVSVGGRARDLLGAPGGEASVTLGGLRIGDGGTLDETVFRMEGRGGRLRATLTTAGEFGVPVRAEAQAEAVLDGAVPTLRLVGLDSMVAEVPIRLTEPMTVTLGTPVTVDRLALAVDSGRVTGGGRLDPSDLDVALTVADLPAGLIRLMDPTLKVDGTVQVRAGLRGPLADPAGSLTVSTDGIRLTEAGFEAVPALVADIEARVEDRRMTGRLRISAGEGVRVEGNASLPLAAGAPGQPPVPAPDGAINAALDALVDVTLLDSFLPIDPARIGGRAQVDIEITGTLDEPVVSGVAELRDGEVDYPVTGLALRDVLLVARGQRDRLVLETLTGTAVAGGEFQGSGWISLDADGDLPAEATLTARRLVVAEYDLATVPVDVDLALSGRLPTWTLAGTVTVLDSEIRLPSALPATVVDLQVVEVDGEGRVLRAPESPQSRDADQGTAAVELDMVVDIAGPVMVRGRGLTSEWSGRLTVVGPVDAPIVDGSIDARRGSMSALGRTFTLATGQVAFDGGPPDNPTLDIALEAEAAEILARVLVQGPAQDPEIRLDSQPPLPREEILSRILFDSDRAELTPVQALRLARSAAVLSGRLEGGGFLDDIRDTLGLDTLDVETTNRDDGGVGAAVSAGRYVAPGVFLKFQQGVTGTDSRAVIEVDVIDNITVQTDASADSEGRVGVNYKLDY